MSMPDLLSTADVAEVLGVDRKTVLRYLGSGKLRGHRIGRDYRIERKALMDFLEETSTDSPKPSDMGLATITVLANQKGGVAKTTSTHALGTAMVERAKRVLLVDLDPQASLTWACGVDPEFADTSQCRLPRQGRVCKPDAHVTQHGGIGEIALPA